MPAEAQRVVHRLASLLPELRREFPLHGMALFGSTAHAGTPDRIAMWISWWMWMEASA